MTRPRSWRKLLAVPAAISLALGGVLLTAAPATAAPGTLVVSTPTEGSTPATRAVVVSGTGSEGAGVSAVNADASVLGAAVVTGGVWSITLAFTDAAPTAQAITVTQILLPDPEPDTATVNILLPAAAPGVPEGPIVVDEPADGETFPTRTVTFTGSAPVGSTLTFAVGDGEIPVSLPIEADGTFTFDFTFPFILGDNPGVTFAGVDSAGVALVPVELSVNLPAPIAAPVIVSPTTGSSVTGPTFTVRGTGIPGTSVLVLILPNDEATLAAVGSIDPNLLAPFTVVAPDGTFSVSTTLPFGSYGAAAFHTTTPPTADDAELLSEASNEVAFTLVAPVVPAAILPATGAVTGGFAAPAGLLVLAGLLLVAVSRRRSALVRPATL